MTDKTTATGGWRLGRRRTGISKILDEEFCARYPELAAHIARRRANRVKRRRLRWTLPLLTLITALAGSGLVFVTPAAATSHAAEEAPLVTLKEVASGSLVFKTATPGRYAPAPLLDNAVDIKVSGMVARVTVRQHFENRGKDWVEGIYAFPLPENAAVDTLRLKIGERIIEGEIKERAEARKTYERAKASGKRASLVEQQRPNLFTNSVANIGPGERVEVEIGYLQTLRFDAGQFSLRFPMTLTPRFIPGDISDVHTSAVEAALKVRSNGWPKNTQRVPDASQITPPMTTRRYAQDGSLRNAVSLQVELDAGMPLAQVSSLYHSTHIARDDNVYRLGFAAGREPMDRDFELVWRPAVGAEPRAAVFSETVAGEHYTLLMVMPPQAGRQADDDGRSVPREVIFVIDTSGSMQGTSIEQARAALAMALDRLAPGDSFNIIEFNSKTRALFAGPVPATDDMLSQARHWVRGLNANGGTQMLPAIKRALLGVPPTGHLRQVVFITDGAVGNEQELFRVIEEELGDSRLFTVGIGSAPNGHFMRKAAQFGRGTFTYIGDQQQVQARMLELFEKLERPVLTDVKIDWPDGSRVETWPQRVPDLYAGEPVVVSARGVNADGELKLSGTTGGQAWTRQVQLSSGQAHAGVAALWARSKIAALMDQLTSGAAPDEVRRQVVEVALAHRLVSKYTSLVAVDKTPVRNANEPMSSKKVANQMPKGSNAQAIFGNYPATATFARLNLLLGIALMLLATLLWQQPQRVRLS